MTSLILIKDIINNKEFIYNSTLVHPSSSCFDHCIEYIKNTYQLQNANHSTHNNFCEIFLENETLHKGWIWNSTETTKQVIYLLSTVPVLSNFTTETQTVETQTVETQTVETQTVETQTVETQTDIQSHNTKCQLSQLQLQYQYYNDQERLFDHFETSVDIYPLNPFNFHKNTIDPLQLCNNKNKYDTRSTQSTRTPVLDLLTTELKSKLQLPNYGLKNTNYH